MKTACLMLFAAAVSAAPMLRLSNSVVMAQVPVGGNAASQTLPVTNAGDGTLSLTVTVSPDTSWLLVGYCDWCHFIQLSFFTAKLAAGSYIARVTLSDPNAVDSPQVVIVTLQVGVTPIDKYMAPGTVVSVDIPGISGLCFLPCPTMTATTSDGGRWLVASLTSEGTIFYETPVELLPPAGMAPGTYTGNVAIGPPINENIPVTMHLTTLPIAVPSTNEINLRLAQNGPAAVFPFLPSISLSNSGMGTLQVTGVSGSGTGVSAIDYLGLALVRVFPGSLAPGTYTDGMVTIQCNAANCPVQVPVNLEIVPQGPPTIQYQGALDNATFSPTGSPGDVMIVKGEQLSLEGPVFASAPLPTTLGGASVLVDGVATPLYYSSFGQIAFQARAGTYLGPGLVQMVRDGQYSNTISVNMAQYAPGIAAVTDTSYNPVDATHPAKAGQALIFWAIGLGPTNPTVADGAAAPDTPLAAVTVPVSVLFHLGGFSETVSTPSFVGLSPGSVGLYQVVAAVPTNAPKGTVSARVVLPGGSSSNSVSIAVQ